MLTLDHRKIEPISFEPVAKAESGVGFEIAFNSEDEASAFRAGIRIDLTRPSDLPM
jgi:hypothetical protein